MTEQDQVWGLGGHPCKWGLLWGVSVVGMWRASITAAGEQSA